MVLGVAYKNLHELLITNHSADTNTTNKIRFVTVYIILCCDKEDVDTQPKQHVSAPSLDFIPAPYQLLDYLSIILLV